MKLDPSLLVKLQSGTASSDDLALLAGLLSDSDHRPGRMSGKLSRRYQDARAAYTCHITQAYAELLPSTQDLSRTARCALIGEAVKELEYAYRNGLPMPDTGWEKHISAAVRAGGGRTACAKSVGRLIVGTN